MVSSLVALRRELHAHPELSGQEHRTAERIVEFLTQLNPDRIITGVGGTGVIATFQGERPGPVVLLRSELDALPITELGEISHTSVNAGIAHKCGHDGHMAMLCGLAESLAANRPARGAVHLLFQPAEETGTGAAAVLADPAFADITADVAIAIHNMPGFPLHTVVVKTGDVTPAVRGMVLRFTGRTAHASEPELGENPALAVADLLHACARWSAGGSRARDLQLVTPVHVRLGSVAYGVSAGDAEVHLTLRTRTSEALAALHHQVLETAAELADRDGLVLDSEVVEDFHATRNTPAVADVVARAAESAGLDVLRPDVGIPAGEDFGLFTERFPGCLVLLGAGEEHDPLHNPHYDFPDELIATGVSFYVAVVDSLLR